MGIIRRKMISVMVTLWVIAIQILTLGKFGERFTDAIIRTSAKDHPEGPTFHYYNEEETIEESEPFCFSSSDRR